MYAAETPFEFFTVSYLTRIGNQSADTLTELLIGLRVLAKPLRGRSIEMINSTAVVEVLRKFSTAFCHSRRNSN